MTETPPRSAAEFTRSVQQFPSVLDAVMAGLDAGGVDPAAGELEAALHQAWCGLQTSYALVRHDIAAVRAVMIKVQAQKPAA
jgi:hypothetical protein